MSPFHALELHDDEAGGAQSPWITSMSPPRMAYLPPCDSMLAGTPAANSAKSASSVTRTSAIT